ncbi:MAG: LysR family transcriptional regulator [Candidatus Saccharimonadales bacterium]
MDDSLRKFVAVVEAGTFTRAAELLHISQPALSVAVAKLEKNIGEKLLESNGRHGVVLTEAGKVVYAAALEHRRVAQNLRLELISLGSQKVPLRLGLIDSVAVLLANLPRQLRLLESTTELSLFVANSASLRRGIMQSELDVAIIVADDQADDRLEVAATTADTLVLVCSPEMQKVLQAQVDAREPMPFLSYVRSSATYNIIDTHLRRSKIQTRTVLYSSSPDVMLGMVERGKGAAVLPRLLVKDKIDAGTLAVLQHKTKPYEIQRRLHVVTLKGRKIPPRLVGLALAMREQLKAYTIA